MESARGIVAYGRVRAGLGMSRFLVDFAKAGYEIGGKVPLAAVVAVFDVGESDDGEHDCAAHVDEDVCHGIMDADIEVAVGDNNRFARGRSYRSANDVSHMDGYIGIRGVERYRAEGGDNRVFLHVKAHEGIHCVFEKLPKRTDGHGEAESRDGHVDRRKLQARCLAAIEDVGQGESDACGKKAPKRMEHGVPEGDLYVEGIYFSEDFCSEDEKENDSFKDVGDFYLQFSFEEIGYCEKNENKDAQERVFVPCFENRPDSHDDNDDAQYQINAEQPGLVLCGFFRSGKVAGKCVHGITLS